MTEPHFDPLLGRVREKDIPAPAAGGTGSTSSSTPSSAPVEAKDEGVSLTSTLGSINFTGAGVTASASGNDVTVNVPGGGAVDSVNGQTGTVVLDTDDVSDAGATNKYVTAAEKTKLSNLSGTNTGDQDLSGYVPATRAVNGHALSADVTVTKSDVGLGSVTNDAQIKASDFPAASVDGEIVLFSSTTGKVLKRATTTGLLKASSGVIAAAASGTDYAPATSGSSILKGNGSGGFSSASAGTDYYNPGGTDVALADGGTGASLTDPNADRILFWDDSAGQMTWLTPGTNLTITGTTIDASGSSSGGGTETHPLIRATLFRHMFGEAAAAASTTVAMVSGQLYFRPVVFGRNVTVSELMVSVTTGAASTKAHIGIYSNRYTGGYDQPDALLYETGDLATTGIADVAQTGVNYTMNAGTLYWVAILANGTPTIRGLAVGSCLPMGRNAATGYTYFYMSSQSIPMPNPIPTLTVNTNYFFTNATLPAIYYTE